VSIHFDVTYNMHKINVFLVYFFILAALKPIQANDKLCTCVFICIYICIYMCVCVCVYICIFIYVVLFKCASHSMDQKIDIVCLIGNKT
jgi:hypothetical protein